MFDPRLALAPLALAALLAIAPGQASAQACGGGPLSTSSGNVVGSLAGAALGGLLGNQIGHGSGKGVATGVGVVGGALAGGAVGRSVECSNSAPPPSQGAYGAPPPASYQPAVESRTCRYVLTSAVIDGQTQQLEGVVCLAPDGSWRTASDPGARRAAQYDLVLRAQQQLRAQGFYERNNIDGRWGPATSAAVRNFQVAHALPASGRLDFPTRAALGLDQATPVAAQAAPPPPPAYGAPPAAATPAYGAPPVNAQTAPPPPTAGAPPPMNAQQVNESQQ